MMSLSKGGVIHTGAIRPLPTVAQCSALKAAGEINDMDVMTDKHYVYVVGSLNAHFPNLSVEKAFYQACVLTGVDVSRLESVNDEVSLSRLNQDSALKGLLYKGLAKVRNSYVAREMNWVFSNLDDNEIYSLLPISDEKLIQFVAALGEDQPLIMVGQLLDDGRVLVSNLIPTKSTPLNKVVEEEKIKAASFKDLVDEILSLNSSDGYHNADRGLNYVLYHNDEIYRESFKLCYKANPGGPNPSGYQVVNTEVFTYWSGKRLIAKIIFNYQGINTGAKQSWYSAVDVTGEYPFLVTPWKRFLPHV